MSRLVRRKKGGDMKKYNQSVVENFVAGLDKSMPQWVHVANTNSDAKSYRWHPHTTKAILRAIEDIYAKRRVL
jgi:hypothetical protein